MKKTTLAIATLTTAVLLSACGTATTQPEQPAQPSADLSVHMVTRSNHLGWQLVATAEAGENAIVSPASATTALAMLAPGVGPSATEALEQVLGASPQDAVTTVETLIGQLADHDGDPATFDIETPPAQPFLHLANNVVLDTRLQAQEGYLEALKRHFEAHPTYTDLSGEEGKAVLDEWVAHHTAGLIEHSAIETHEDLRLVLQNAVLFGASWDQPFMPAGTHEFTDADGDMSQVEIMSLDTEVRFAQLDGWSAIEVPYTTDFVSTFILPPPRLAELRIDPQTTTETITALRELLDAAEPTSTRIVLPVLDQSTKTELMPLLKDLGADILGDCGADPLAGIGPDLCVDQAVQQAVLNMDTAGTIAAAVTEIGVGITSAPEPPAQQFIAERPYLLTVTHVDSDWDIFQGVIRDLGQE